MVDVSAAALVDRALATARRLNPDGGAVVVVSETSEAVLRWANSTMTTNGSTTDRRWTVIALVPLGPGGYGDRGGRAGVGAGGFGAGVITSSAPGDLVRGGREADAAVENAVRAAVDAAVRSGPARDAADLPGPGGEFDAAFVEPAADTSVAVFDRLVGELADSFTGEPSFGFAEHRVTTRWLGTSAGVRRRWVEPDGSVELNLKDPATGASAWGGSATRDFTDVTLPPLS